MASALAAPRPATASGERARLLVCQSVSQNTSQRVPAVERRRLLRLLVAEAEVPIVVISASAGYGKSILAGQWSNQGGRAVALLSLEARHSNPLVLLNHLAQSLERLAP